MQVLRLVKPGTVDRLIAFDSLPERFFSGVQKVTVKDTGLPRHWSAHSEFHYYLDYTSVNRDKEVWSQISQFVRKTVDPTFRLLDNLEDMGRPMAPDSYSPVSIEPEEITIIPIPEKYQEKATPIEKKESIIENEVKPSNDDEKELSKIKEKHTCKTMGRRGVYVDGCPRCEQLKSARLVAA